MNPVTVERWFAAGLTAVGVVSPRLAGRLALRLFCTPIPSRPSSGALAFMADAVRHDIPWDKGTVAAYEIGAGPAVLLAHGWSAHGASMRGFAHALAARGLRAVCVDLPAHANSSGKTTNMLESGRALGAVLDRLGPFHGAVCHSFGAPSLLLGLARMTGPAPERLVTVGAPNDIDKVFSDYSRRFRLSGVAEANMRARVDEIFGSPFLEFDVAAQAWTFGENLLVVHDTGDLDVPYAEGVHMAGERGRLLTTKGLGHNRVLRDPGVIEAVTDFLAGPGSI